jgi:glycosyltransferase involved in cell wall biosynthesis
LPISILEAMAFGLPVVTTPVGGLKGFFKDDKMGYFVQPRDVEQLVEKLELLILDLDKIIETGKYNYEYAHTKLLNTAQAERMHQHMQLVQTHGEKNG